MSLPRASNRSHPQLQSKTGKDETSHPVKKSCKNSSMTPTPSWTETFPVIGKGVFLFNVSREWPFSIVVRSKRAPNTISVSDESWIRLLVDDKEASFFSKRSREQSEDLLICTNEDEFFGTNVGVEINMTCTYWFSYDSDRMVIKYGKGYHMEKTTILQYQFEDTEENLNLFFDPTVQRTVELYESVKIRSKSVVEMEKEVDFDPNPLVSDRNPIVMDSSKANLFAMDDNRYTYSSSLPLECQSPYAIVSAEDFDLDYVDPNVKHYNFKLVDAIRYSIETEGCVLNDKLKEKCGDDPQENYLRVGVGSEFGTSPGVPYVLELWPKSCYSPVHNHGNAYAIIRVLHGGLTILYYNKTSVSKCSTETNDHSHDVLGQFEVKKGDVTFASPNWYQTHKLQNDTADFCATIQCYAYGSNDNTHWPYFDMIASCDTIEEFKPHSDFTFHEMYELVMEEYAATHAGK